MNPFWDISLSHTKVHLKEATDLLACDYTGLSDPYVKFIIDGKTHYKSKTIYKNLNPIWNESLQIPVQKLEQALLVQVFDHDFIGRDDLIGSCWFELRDLEIGKDEDFEKKLENSKQGGELGSIKLSIGAHEISGSSGLRKFSESTDCSFEFDTSYRCKEIGWSSEKKIFFYIYNVKK